jgi:hypothetical protein
MLTKQYPVKKSFGRIELPKAWDTINDVNQTPNNVYWTWIFLNNNEIGLHIDYFILNMIFNVPPLMPASRGH